MSGSLRPSRFAFDVFPDGSLGEGIQAEFLPVAICDDRGELLVAEGGDDPLNKNHLPAPALYATK
jgi:hypothetical protein